ncbi:MAG TPA: carbamoyltransferase HypF [Verrucomicrobiae bacterium]
MTSFRQPATSSSRLKIALRGAVQGVGFRPFVFRLAEELKLTGWVNNSPQGVFIEVEGSRAALENFRFRLEAEKPPRSFIQSLESSWLDAVGYPQFEIRASENSGGKSALVLPDIATCPDCLREIFDPTNRRHRYPFTNCTNCGPRFSIIEALPYDRANTSMKQFTMCPACQAEYDDPRDRRFHAQPNACPVCGPRLEFWQGRTGVAPVSNLRKNGDRRDACPTNNAALLAAAESIRWGKIVAVKGLGGFHLLVDARNEKAIQRLRARKHREEKPFALMFSSLASIQAVCEVSPLEERLLCSPEAPIVLLRRNPSSILHPPSSLSSAVAPGNPNLGVMLPSNPLHHLLMAELGFPVIATSGNLSDEPICTDEHEALKRLAGIADVFLVHNRPIVRHLDDSIVRVMLGREMVLRRARGFAPLPISIPVAADVRRLTSQGREQIEPPHVGCYETVLAVGAHLKNSVALAVGGNVFISQHIGDLETAEAHQAFRRVAADLPRLYDAEPEIVVADLHPDYLSTKFADEIAGRAGRPLPTVGAHGVTRPTKIAVQHHVAHVLSCLAENEVPLPALGVAWDGTGYGTDGTIWGGEFFLVTKSGVERVAHLRPFRLPGGDAAVKEPRRVALGLLFEVYGEAVFQRKDLPVLSAFSAGELATLKTMLKRGLNSPLTTSVGRLFDGVASLAGLRQQMRFEGQAAMELEFALDGIESDEAYEIRLTARADARPTESAIGNRQSAIILDWSPMVEAILSDVQNGVATGIISAKFHHALAEAVVAVAKRMGEKRVAISGGCFQNRYLTERMVTRLREEMFSPYWHQRVPTNDGGIALGQIFAARNQLNLK